MSALLATLGLGPPAIGPTPSLTGYYAIFNFVFAYAALSTRGLKKAYGLDHNVAPREDVALHGDAAVAAGKITRQQLAMLKRNEAAHANAVENYPLFLGALLWAHVAGLPRETINRSALAYTLLRAAYAVVYVRVDKESASHWRSLIWWAANISCLRLFWLGTKKLNT